LPVLSLYFLAYSMCARTHTWSPWDDVDRHFTRAGPEVWKHSTRPPHDANRSWTGAGRRNWNVSRPIPKTVRNSKHYRIYRSRGPITYYTMSTLCAPPTVNLSVGSLYPYGVSVTSPWKYLIIFIGVRLSPLGTSATTGLLYQP
jgi:hypothetical protein